MRTRTTGLALGATLLTTLSLTGCSGSDQSESGPATTVTVTADAKKTPRASSAHSSSTHARQSASSVSSAVPSAHSTGKVAQAGQRCAVGENDTVGLVVTGSMKCTTLHSLWKRAVAHPDFARHGNHNRIVMDDWTCRANQTRPVQTGFCSSPSHHAKFKVIHR